MSRKYLCDNCGAEFDSLDVYDEKIDYQINRLWTFGISESSILHKPCYSKIGEYCRDCSNKLQKLVKEGF